MRRIYFDTEFTGLHQKTKLISIGIVSDRDDIFYAEFNDYHSGFVSLSDEDFVRGHVVPHLLGDAGIMTMFDGADPKRANLSISGSTEDIAPALSFWLNNISHKPGSIQVWSDCYAYDWMLFCQLFGHALDIPNCLHYIPMDLSTYLEVMGIDPGINREEFAMLPDWEDHPKHNALHDAKAIKMCVERLWDVRVEQSRK